MEFGHVVVWLDQSEAHVIHFNRDAAEAESIKAGKRHQHANGAKMKLGEDTAFLGEVTASIKDAEEILVVGPGMEKLALIKYLAKHDHATSDKVVGVESVDHPSNAQLLAYARKYFKKVDQIIGASV